MRWVPFLAIVLVSQPLFGQATPNPVMLAAPSAELPSYKLSGSPDDGLVFVAENFPLKQGPEVDAMMAAEAQRRCAPKIAFPGGYRRMTGNITVNGQAVVGFTRYERTALCVDPMKPIEAAPTDFHPTPNDEGDLLSAFEAYFSAFDAGRIDAMMPLRDYPPFPRNMLFREVADYKSQFGQQKRIVLKTSWYPNPPELHNGIFGEVLFSQPISDTKTLCGAAMFYKRAEHDFVLSRVLTVPIDGPSKGNTEDVHSCSR